jgi:hypothetical protein
MPIISLKREQEEWEVFMFHLVFKKFSKLKLKLMVRQQGSMSIRNLPFLKEMKGLLWGS